MQQARSSSREGHAAGARELPFTSCVQLVTKHCADVPRSSIATILLVSSMASSSPSRLTDQPLCWTTHRNLKTVTSSNHCRTSLFTLALASHQCHHSHQNQTLTTENCIFSSNHPPLCLQPATPATAAVIMWVPLPHNLRRKKV